MGTAVQLTTHSKAAVANSTYAVWVTMIIRDQHARRMPFKGTNANAADLGGRQPVTKFFGSENKNKTWNIFVPSVMGQTRWTLLHFGLFGDRGQR
jgi:hypothetical protein